MQEIEYLEERLRGMEKELESLPPGAEEGGEE